MRPPCFQLDHAESKVLITDIALLPQIRMLGLVPGGQTGDL